MRHIVAMPLDLFVAGLFAELANLPVEKIQIRQGHWVIVDLVGKGGHVRTIPIPQWAKEKLDRWTSAATISSGRVFRAIRKNGTVWGDRINVNVVWHVVNRYCRSIGLEHVAPHDLRRTCAKLCHASGGELEQIQFLLGHVSVQTTERYLGCKQNLSHPVNDRFEILRADRRPRLNVHWPVINSYVQFAATQFVETRFNFQGLGEGTSGGTSICRSASSAAVRVSPD